MIELLRNRRSIRKYTDQAIEEEKIELLKESVLRSPTSRNNKPGEYIFVSDKDLLYKLSLSKPHGAAFLKDAPLGVVVIADESKSDVWVEDCSIASIILQLSAQSLGLGSCWIQLRKRFHSDNTSAEDYVKDLLKLPDGIRVESIIAIGYAAETRKAVSYDELDFNKIIEK